MSIFQIKTTKKNFYSIFKKGAHFFYSFIKPKSQNEDFKRKEFILNVILTPTILLSFTAVFFVIIDSIHLGKLYRGESLIFETAILGIFVFLYFLSRKGLFIIASYLLIGLYFLTITNSIYKWGADLPVALLIYVLIIIMSGILISTRFAVISTVAVSITILIISYLQINHIANPRSYWRLDSIKIEDVIIIILIFGIISIISWLSNREIEKSLIRARKSEEELKKERDSLELKVQERTRELKEAQIEKALQLHRFAEFGKLASGIFHDLTNPLTTAILNIENLKTNSNSPEMERLSQSIDKMKVFTESARKQLQKQEVKSIFNPDSEIKSAIETLSYKARRLNINITYKQPDNQIKLFGDPIKFYRVTCDILSNAIDAYDDLENQSREKNIYIILSQEKKLIRVSIQDWGEGIDQENIEKIFQPLFTTKNPEKGIGLGLAICKDIIEKDFDGTIQVKSSRGDGSIFIISLPAKL